MEIDSYLKSVYDKTQNISSASFSSFFEDATNVTNQFKEATSAMNDGIKASWDDSVRIIFSGTATLISEQFDILDNSIQRLTPIGGYVDQFNDLMRAYIQSVKQVNTLEAEKNSIRVPAPPTNTKDKESSGDQSLEHSEIFARETALHRIRVLEEEIKKEEELIESQENACEGLINKISDILSYHPKFGSVPALSTDYDNVDYETYEDDESQMFHYYVNYYKDGKLVRRDYDTYDGDRSTRGTKYYYENTINDLGEPVEVVRENHIEYSRGYELDGFVGRTDTVIENGILKYNRNGQVISGDLEKYSYTKLPDPDSFYSVTENNELDNYSFKMDSKVKISDVSAYSSFYDNQRVLTTESYDTKTVVRSDGYTTITNGYNVTRTPDNMRLTEHKDSVYQQCEDENGITSRLTERNYNFTSNPDGSSRSTWDYGNDAEGYYTEHDSSGHSICYGYDRKEDSFDIVTNFRRENVNGDYITTYGSKTHKGQANSYIENDVTFVRYNNGDISREIGSVELLNKDGSVGKRLEGVTETYGESIISDVKVMKERTIDHVYRSDGTVENDVHDYLANHVGNTSIIERSVIGSITASDGSVIDTNVVRTFDDDNTNYYAPSKGSYGYERYGMPEGYVCSTGTSGYGSEPSINYDNQRYLNYAEDGYGDYD